MPSMYLDTSKVLKFEDCGKHCRSWEFPLWGLNSFYLVLQGFFTCLQGAVAHWPNRIYSCYLGLLYKEKFNTNRSTPSEGQSDSARQSFLTMVIRFCIRSFCVATKAFVVHCREDSHSHWGSIQLRAEVLQRCTRPKMGQGWNS